MSSWLVVCFTLDRYIAVRHPLQRSRLCTEKRAKLIIVFLLLFLMASQAFRLYYIEKLDRQSATKCHAPKKKRIEYYAVHYFLFSFLLRFFIPFLIICIFNGMIIFHIQKMRKMRRDSREGWSPSASTNSPINTHACTTLTSTNTSLASRNTNMAITMLFTVCIVFIVTLLPNAIISVIQFIQHQTTPDYTLFCNLWKMDAPLQMIRLSNYAINFVIYGFTGRQFRRELFRMFSRVRRRSSSNGYHPCHMRIQEMKMLRSNPGYRMST